jgi:glycosyltransferase involved in cell wall biosynthesis
VKGIMRITDRDILLISPEPWEGLRMSKHHVAEALVAAGNRVCFLGPPDDARSARLSGEGALRMAHYRHWLPGVNRAPRWVQRWYYLHLIRRLEVLRGARFDLLWCFDTSRLRFFPDGPWLKLLHLVDLDILFTGDGLVRSADVVVATTDPIVRRVKAIDPSVPAINVGHGLDGRWLEAAPLERPAAPGSPRTVAYASEFYNTYIDWVAVVRIVEAHPDLRFLFIGPYDPGYPDAHFQRLRGLPNAEFTGLVTKDVLVGLLRNADLLWYCFKAEAAEQCANPHKVLEYLSTGAPIVGSRTIEYERHAGLIEMAEGTEAMVGCFASAVVRFAELNTPERRTARRTFAADRTTRRLIERIGDAIDRGRQQP